MENIVEVIGQLRNMRLCKNLDEETLTLLAESCEAVSLAENSILEVEPDQPFPFYLITSGKVLVSIPKGKNEYTDYVLKDGDFFGGEVVLHGKHSLYMVSGMIETHLLRIDVDQLAVLLHNSPLLKANLQEAMDIYRTIRGRHFQWLGEDETVYLLVREHPAALIVSMALPFLWAWGAIALFWLADMIGVASFSVITEWIAVGVTLFALGLAIWRFFDWRNDYYLLTDQRVVWLEQTIGLYDSRQEAPINAIRSEVLNSTFFGRLFGFADVIVKTYMGQVPLHNIGEPERVKAMIQEVRRMDEQREQTAGADMMANIIKRKLTPPETVQETPAPAPLQLEDQPEKIPPPPAPATRLTDYFSSRIEQGDVITYRKHGYVLFKKVWLPSLFMILILAGMIYLLYLSISGSLEFPSTIAILLFGLFLLSLPTIGWLYQYIDWRNDIYQITTDRIVDSDKKPLGDEHTKSALLENIQSMEHVRLGILGILLNYGSVIISVGTETQFTFDGIRDPARAQQDIFNRMQSNQKKKEQSEASKRWEEVGDWLAVFKRLTDEPQQNQNPSKFDQNSG